MKARRCALTAFVALFVSLIPMAHASPPDPTWIPGFYDAADIDDVVAFLTSDVGAVELFPLDGVGPAQMPVTRVVPLDDRSTAARAPSGNRPRAPPSSS